MSYMCFNAGFLLFRFTQGTYSEAPYAFYHWQYIDIFNYFTHNMVTIPPAVWTNAAHRHGVLVLGEQRDGYIKESLLASDAHIPALFGTRYFHHGVERWGRDLRGLPQR